ncbi:cytochrome b [Agrobacterium sp. ES01]|uniref:cytochrome b n=1 Tax=Agrobacterium sp. ES01 TaxID=3420714 RepID=UPI003D14412C
MPSSNSYSIPQKALHWTMAALIFFNLILSDGMEIWNRTVSRGETPTVDQISSANIHAYVGIAVLCLAILRLLLRLFQGGPSVPANEPPLAKIAAKVTHVTFYLLFFLLPLTGIGRYYFGNETAGELHGGPLKLVLWALIVLHILAVLVHHFIWKTDVATRMTKG